MGAHLYWSPGKGEPFRDVELGRLWSSLEVTPTDVSAVVDSLGGSRTVTRWTSWNQVRITCELSYGLSTVATGGLIQELEALCGHLQRGGMVAMAEDDDATFAGYLTRSPPGAATAIKLRKNQWKNWSNPDIGAGDILRLRGPSPRTLEEGVRVATKTGVALTLTDPLRYDYSSSPWVFARDSRFWPYLRLQAGARGSQLLTANRRILYTLDLPLEEALGKFDPPDVEFTSIGESVNFPTHYDDAVKDPGIDYEDLPVLEGRLP